MKIKILLIAASMMASMTAAASCSGAMSDYESALNTLQNLLQSNAPSQQIAMAAASVDAARTDVIAECHQF